MVTSFIRRWSQRKRAAAHQGQEAGRTDSQVTLAETLQKTKAGATEDGQEQASSITETPPLAAASPENALQTEDDATASHGAAAPALPTMHEVATVSYAHGVDAFMQAGVDKAVKKAALQKLFHSEEFNYISEMDDHTENFAGVASLDQQVTRTLRRWVTETVEQQAQSQLSSTEGACEDEGVAAINVPAQTDESQESVSSHASQTAPGSSGLVSSDPALADSTGTAHLDADALYLSGTTQKS